MSVPVVRAMAQPTPTSIMLVTGEYFEHSNPDPSVINLDVLEHGLNVPRFNNQTTRPITVLEHSLRVARIAKEINIAAELWGLLHDAHEAVLPWGDCLRPGKTDEMRAIEREVDFAIWDAFNISPDSLVRDTIKTADNIALYFEAMLWAPGASDWAPLVWPPIHKITGGGEHPRPSRGPLIERFMPLIAPRPGECWRTEVEALLGGRHRVDPKCTRCEGLGALAFFDDGTREPWPLVGRRSEQGREPRMITHCGVCFPSVSA